MLNNTPKAIFNSAEGNPSGCATHQPDVSSSLQSSPTSPEMHASGYSYAFACTSGSVCCRATPTAPGPPHSLCINRPGACTSASIGAEVDYIVMMMKVSQENDHPTVTSPDPRPSSATSVDSTAHSISTTLLTPPSADTSATASGGSGFGAYSNSMKARKQLAGTVNLSLPSKKDPTTSPTAGAGDTHKHKHRHSHSHNRHGNSLTDHSASSRSHRHHPLANTAFSSTGRNSIFYASKLPIPDEPTPTLLNKHMGVGLGLDVTNFCNSGTANGGAGMPLPIVSPRTTHHPHNYGACTFNAAAVQPMRGHYRAQSSPDVHLLSVGSCDNASCTATSHVQVDSTGALTLARSSSRHSISNSTAPPLAPGNISALCRRIQRSEAHAQAKKAAMEEAIAYGRGEKGAGTPRNVFRDADAESTFSGSGGGLSLSGGSVHGGGRGPTLVTPRSRAGSAAPWISRPKSAQGLERQEKKQEVPPEKSLPSRSGSEVNLDRLARNSESKGEQETQKEPLPKIQIFRAASFPIPDSSPVPAEASEADKLQAVSPRGRSRAPRGGDDAQNNIDVVNHVSFEVEEEEEEEEDGDEVGVDVFQVSAKQAAPARASSPSLAPVLIYDYHSSQHSKQDLTVNVPLSDSQNTSSMSPMAPSPVASRPTSQQGYYQDYPGQQSQQAIAPVATSVGSGSTSNSAGLRPSSPIILRDLRRVSQDRRLSIDQSAINARVNSDNDKLSSLPIRNNSIGRQSPHMFPSSDTPAVPIIIITAAHSSTEDSFNSNNYPNLYDDDSDSESRASSGTALKLMQSRSADTDRDSGSIKLDMRKGQKRSENKRAATHVSVSPGHNSIDADIDTSSSPTPPPVPPPPPAEMLFEPLPIPDDDIEKALSVASKASTTPPSLHRTDLNAKHGAFETIDLHPTRTRTLSQARQHNQKHDASLPLSVVHSSTQDARRRSQHAFSDEHKPMYELQSHPHIRNQSSSSRLSPITDDEMPSRLPRAPAATSNNPNPQPSSHAQVTFANAATPVQSVPTPAAKPVPNVVGAYADIASRSGSASAEERSGSAGSGTVHGPHPKSLGISAMRKQLAGTGTYVHVPVDSSAPHPAPATPSVAQMRQAGRLNTKSLRRVNIHVNTVNSAISLSRQSSLTVNATSPESTASVASVTVSALPNTPPPSFQRTRAMRRLPGVGAETDSGDMKVEADGLSVPKYGQRQFSDLGTRSSSASDEEGAARTSFGTGSLRGYSHAERAGRMSLLSSRNNILIHGNLSNDIIPPPPADDDGASPHDTSIVAPDQVRSRSSSPAAIITHANASAYLSPSTVTSPILQLRSLHQRRQSENIQEKRDLLQLMQQRQQAIRGKDGGNGESSYPRNMRRQTRVTSPRRGDAPGVGMVDGRPFCSNMGTGTYAYPVYNADEIKALKTNGTITVNNDDRAKDPDNLDIPPPPPYNDNSDTSSNVSGSVVVQLCYRKESSNPRRDNQNQPPVVAAPAPVAASSSPSVSTSTFASPSAASASATATASVSASPFAPPRTLAPTPPPAHAPPLRRPPSPKTPLHRGSLPSKPAEPALKDDSNALRANGVMSRLHRRTHSMPVVLEEDGLNFAKDSIISPMPVTKSNNVVSSSAPPPPPPPPPEQPSISSPTPSPIHTAPIDRMRPASVTPPTGIADDDDSPPPAPHPHMVAAGTASILASPPPVSPAVPPSPSPAANAARAAHARAMSSTTIGKTVVNRSSAPPLPPFASSARPATAPRFAGLSINTSAPPLAPSLTTVTATTPGPQMPRISLLNVSRGILEQAPAVARVAPLSVAPTRNSVEKQP